MTDQTIFLAALDIPDPARRATYLSEACAGSESLRRQVESLLAAHDRSGEFLDEPAVEQIGRRPNADTVTADSTGAVPPDHSLTYLQPPTRTGSLGRMAHYEVLEVLGRGGFGTVLRAFDDRLHRVVAIKVLAPQLAASGTARARFEREARAAAAVRDEHVVSVHAVTDSTEPVPYLVMEFVGGQTLQQKIDRTGPLSVPEVLRIGMQTARGLAAAHATGHIHRDIKPSNILLENGVERVKITDFGLARAADDASISHSGLVAGTPMYMAPEQARGEKVDHRADLFSLGSVLYAMCTGRPPFRASTTMGVLKRVAEDAARPVRDVNPEVPEALAAVIAKLHAKDPADRFQSAREVADLLQKYLAHGVPTIAAPSPAPAVRSSPRRTAARSPVTFWFVTVLAVTAAAFVVGVQWRFGELDELWHLDLTAAAFLVPLLWLYARRVWPGEARPPMRTERAVAEVTPQPRNRQVGPPVRRRWLSPRLGGVGLATVTLMILGTVLVGYLLVTWPIPARGTLILHDLEPGLEVSIRQGDKFVHERSTRDRFVLPAHDDTVVIFYRAGSDTETFRKDVAIERDEMTFINFRRELAAVEDRNRAGVRNNLGEIGRAVADLHGGEWVKLFNGRDLTGWQAHPEHPGPWTVADGVLRGSGARSFLIGTGEFTDFHLRCKVRISVGGDGGLFFWADDGLTGSGEHLRGFEAQINATDPSIPRTGSLIDSAARHQAGIVSLDRPDEWFTYEVIAEGNRIRLKVNDLTTLDWTDKQNVRRRGRLAIQLENPRTVAEFQSIEVRELTADPDRKPGEQ